MEELRSATARAFANIAFIKYWGNRDEQLRLPASPSLSMNLAGLHTDTTVRWGASEDSLTINGRRAEQAAITRVAAHLDELRNRLSITGRAAVASETNIPIGAGIASSAAAFAALTVAAVAAAGRQADEATLSALARLGSGSAARSVPGGFVAWPVSDAHETCCAHSIAAAEHWPLADVIAIVDAGEKEVSSRRGHQSAPTSPLQGARIASADERFARCQQAILQRDFDEFAAVVEQDSNMMHAVMLTSSPPLLYWREASLTVMRAVMRWRARGLPVCYTLDAGPNVHSLCPAEYAEQIRQLLAELPGVRETKLAFGGGGARILRP